MRRAHSLLILREVGSSNPSKDELKRVENEDVERVRVFGLGFRSESEEESDEVRGVELDDEGGLKNGRWCVVSGGREEEGRREEVELTCRVDFSIESVLDKLEPTESLMARRFRTM